MAETRKYTHIHTDHISLVLKTRAGDRVKWPDEVKGPENESHQKQIRKAAKNHLISDGKLLHKITFTKTINARSIDDLGWREVPHESKRQSILEKVHTNGGGCHLARDPLIYELQAKYYWVGMTNDVNAFIDKCEHCATMKIRTGIPKPPTKPIVADRILERIQIDFTSFEYADPNTGDRHILTVLDCFSKFGWAKSFPTQEVEPIARWIFELFLNELQYPEILQSDNGKSFLAKIMKDLLGLFKTKQKNSRPRHPTTNGQIERFNGTLKRKLRERLNKVPKAPWAHLVPVVTAEYNSTYHSTIGRKPVEVFRPYNGNGDARADLDELKAFAENLFVQTRKRNHKKANATIKRHEAKYNLRVYVPGEIVLVDVGKKTKVSKKRDMVKAIIVEALTNNYYTIEYAAGPKIGEQDDINGDLVEPLQKKNQVMHDTIPIRQEHVKKAPKSTIVVKKAVVESQVMQSESDLQDSEKKRSESHWFKQTDNLLTMDRNSRGV